MHGHGVYHFCENNSYYEGAFEGNLLHGHGQLEVATPDGGLRDAQVAHAAVLVGGGRVFARVIRGRAPRLLVQLERLLAALDAGGAGHAARIFRLEGERFGREPREAVVPPHAQHAIDGLRRHAVGAMLCTLLGH